MREFTPPFSLRPEIRIPVGVEFVDPKDGRRKKYDENGDVFEPVSILSPDQHTVEQTNGPQPEATPGPLLKFKFTLSGQGTKEQIEALQLTRFAYPQVAPTIEPTRSGGYASLLPYYNPDASTVMKPGFAERRLADSIVVAPGHSPIDSKDEKQKRRLSIHLTRGKVSKLAVASTLGLSLLVFNGLASQTLSEAKDTAKECASSAPLAGPILAANCEIGKFALGMVDYAGLYRHITGTK